MNPIRLTRRIAEHVTQIGFEMRLVGGIRKLVRVGEFLWVNGEIKVRDLVRYDEADETWVYPEAFSDKASAKIRRLDPDNHGWLLTRGGVVAC